MRFAQTATKAVFCTLMSVLPLQGAGIAPSAPAKRKVVRIEITPGMATLVPGQSAQFSARAYDSKGRRVSGVTFSWSSTLLSVATVGSTGSAQAIGNGIAQIRAQVRRVTGTATVRVDDGTGGGGGLTNLFFLHHSTGDGFVVEGDIRGYIEDYNQPRGTNYEFWDHGYNGDGLRDPAGTPTGTSYEIPDDNTDPDGLYRLWTGSDGVAVASRNLILNNHQVIAFKSCFPASAISDTDTLNQYKSWYLEMRDVFDSRPDRVFVVMSTPPLHRLSTNRTEARNARTFASWLKSSEYLAGHSNIVCFDLFDVLAEPDDGSATANMLRYEYEQSHGDGDSHPNAPANRAVAPLLAQTLIDAALGH